MTCLNHASLAASLAALTVTGRCRRRFETQIPRRETSRRHRHYDRPADRRTCPVPATVGPDPAMDALAADGVRFTRAYCPYPLSGPCRAALVTGRMPFEVRAFDNAIRPADADMQAGIGHRLAEAGYECLYAGKWHVPEVNLPDSGTGFRRISKMNDPALADAATRR